MNKVQVIDGLMFFLVALFLAYTVRTGMVQIELRLVLHEWSWLVQFFSGVIRQFP
jgi:hypothetical protein